MSDLFVNGFNPTFLFSWKNVRTRTEDNYHAHENHMELALIMSGREQYRINDTVYDVGEGDLLILNPGVYHQAIVTDPVHPATEFFLGFTDFNLDGREPNSIGLSGDDPIYKVGSDLKLKLMRLSVMMDSERDSCSEGKYYMMQSFLVQFVLYILRDMQEAAMPAGERCTFENGNKNEIVKQIMQYFEEHYAEKISLDIISENMYLSPFYISKIFKSVTGDTPIRYLIDVRLDKAKNLLLTKPELSVHEVAEMVGYDDAYHFSKLFKKRFGTSPSKIAE